jgi:tetratricopeptide (TPR) repeat protein
MMPVAGRSSHRRNELDLSMTRNEMERKPLPRSSSTLRWLAVCGLVILLAACKQGPSAVDRAGSEDGTAVSDNTPYYYGLIEEYRAMMAADPHNLAAITALGNALYDAGQWREAIGYYDQALRVNPHSADVITDMGTCYRNIGMTDRAIREYERALKVDPTHANALFNMGVVLGRDKHAYDRAIAAWEQLLHVAPNDPRAGIVHAGIDEYRRAQGRRAP